jgi:hypothetical protein
VSWRDPHIGPAASHSQSPGISGFDTRKNRPANFTTLTMPANEFMRLEVNYQH